MLIVEDDAATRLAVRRLMEHRGHRTTAVGTVVEGLEAVRDLRPAAVLLDLMLPDGHGGEILAWVRHNLPDTRVAMVTGCSDPFLVERVANDVRPDVLLRKPADFNQIAAGLNLGA